MTNFKPGDVILIPFPFTNLSTSKQRPCIVISSDDFNTSHDDVVVAAITSRVPDSPSEYHYVLSNAQQKSAGLPKRSMIKLGKIVTLDKRLIRKKLGSLSPESTNSIVEKIHTVIGEQ